MSILRAIIINLFSLIITLCFLKYVSGNLFWTSTPPTTTTSTLRPFTRTPGLSLPRRGSYPPKCWREVPASLFKYEKDVEVEGNSTANKYFNSIEDCCEGYKRYDFDWSRCVPDCGNKCVENGFCIEGGKCSCFNDFVLNHRNDCIPTCPLGCPNGQCYLNGTCVCNEGYELDGEKKFCVPKCEFGCGHNEFCTNPNKCECIEGYSRSIKETGMGCQPICIPDCGMGHCVGPNQCKCFPGFVKRINGTICERNCNMRCDNGFCFDRNTCICQNGFKFDEVTTSCLPDCGDECENGVCTSPGVCRCYNGYQRKGVKCVAICEKGCGFYGRCIAPNICGCSIVDGPTKTIQRCESGYCTSRGRCHCREGTTRFINKCVLPNGLTTHVSMFAPVLNRTLINEFNLLIGQYFLLNQDEFSSQSEYAGFGVIY